MRAQSPLSLGECRWGGSNQSTREDPPARRGSGRSTHIGKNKQHGRPLVAQPASMPRRREESEGPIVPLKPGNDGGGKGPWFGVLQRVKGSGIGMRLKTPDKLRRLQGAL